MNKLKNVNVKTNFVTMLTDCVIAKLLRQGYTMESNVATEDVTYVFTPGGKINTSKHWGSNCNGAPMLDVYDFFKEDEEDEEYKADTLKLLYHIQDDILHGTTVVDRVLGIIKEYAEFGTTWDTNNEMWVSWIYIEGGQDGIQEYKSKNIEQALIVPIHRLIHFFED
jgi:hypothetical protein